MKTTIFSFLIFCLMSIHAFAQDELPYREIPNYPESYNAGTVAAVMIDGLGFRFYWATDSLRTEDLAYKPSEDARTSEETIDHIYSMSWMIVNAVTGTANSEHDTAELSFEEKRKQVLSNLKTASDILRTRDDLENMNIIFEKGGRREYPFWHHLNGPIADCTWHVGQIVSFRRASGNPLTSKVSFFRGKIRK